VTKNKMQITADHAFSPITRVVRLLFISASWLSITSLLRFLPKGYFRHRREFTTDEINDHDYSARRGRAIEIYILCWLVVAATCVSLAGPTLGPQSARWLVAVLATLRVIELVQAPVNAVVFDAIGGRPEMQVATHIRLLVLTVLNVLELSVWFGVVYALRLNELKNAGGKGDAWYFSFATQFTVGYGDIYPTGILRVIASIHMILAFFLILVVLARVLAVLQPMKQMSRLDA
jgi:hypothetical protein